MSLRNQALANSINLLLAALARTRDERKFRWTYTQIARLATLLARKDYYVSRILWIMELFDRDHPALEVTKKILYRTNPHHRKTAEAIPAKTNPIKTLPILMALLEFSLRSE
jgi:hypothetical protein